MGTVLVDAVSGQIYRDLPNNEIAAMMGVDEAELRFYIKFWGEYFTDKWLAVSDWRKHYYADGQHMRETRH